MNVIFMGTPNFAAECLNGLINSKHNVLAVFTKQDKPKGRNHKLVMSPVKLLALDHNIPIYQPTSLKNNEIKNTIENLKPDVVAVAAYGMILPEDILKIPKLRCINVHGSLLPKYRGAAPIQWALINGDYETGITIMYMEKGLDCGDIICKKVIKIEEDDDAVCLFEKLAIIGREELLNSLDLITRPYFKAEKQNENDVVLAPMITKQMGKLDFEKKTAQEVFNLIRGLAKFPVAYININNKILKIYKASIIQNVNLKPCEIIQSKKFVIGCKNNAIELLIVQPENGKKMSGEAFLNGYLKGSTLNLLNYE